MTKTLEKAIERLEQLPEEQQDLLAQLLLHEIDEDERWRQSTAEHSDKLAGVVSEVLNTGRKSR